MGRLETVDEGRKERREVREEGKKGSQRRQVREEDGVGCTKDICLVCLEREEEVSKLYLYHIDHII